MMDHINFVDTPDAYNDVILIWISYNKVHLSCNVSKALYSPNVINEGVKGVRHVRYGFLIYNFFSPLTMVGYENY